MDQFERWVNEAHKLGLTVIIKELKSNAKGIIKGNRIGIRAGLPRLEAACVLAEEIGHYHLTVGNILDQSKIVNRKQELLARRWSFERLVPLTAIVQAHLHGIRNRHELARMLDITEDTLQQALDRYIEKHGLSARVGKYTVIFEPLGVMELFDFEY